MQPKASSSFSCDILLIINATKQKDPPVHGKILSTSERSNRLCAEDPLPIARRYQGATDTRRASIAVIAEQAVLLASDHRSPAPSQVSPVAIVRACSPRWTLRSSRRPLQWRDRAGFTGFPIKSYDTCSLCMKFSAPSGANSSPCAEPIGTLFFHATTKCLLCQAFSVLSMWISLRLYGIMRERVY